VDGIKSEAVGIGASVITGVAIWFRTDVSNIGVELPTGSFNNPADLLFWGAQADNENTIRIRVVQKCVMKGERNDLSGK
jgi:hypothetical protein